MRVAFLHIGNNLLFPLMMLASVRRHLGDIEVIQMTDGKSPTIPDVDARIEMDYVGEMMFYRLAHLSKLPSGDTLVLDTDVIVQGDLSHVFDQDFDAALTRRYGYLDLDGRNAIELMPFNAGVMFCREPRFWEACLRHCATLSDGERGWFGEQLALKAVAESGEFNIVELPCDRYNYSPTYFDEDVSERLAVHYKGKRKPWMVSRGYVELSGNGLAARSASGIDAIPGRASQAAQAQTQAGA